MKFYNSNNNQKIYIMSCKMKNQSKINSKTRQKNMKMK